MLQRKPKTASCIFFNHGEKFLVYNGVQFLPQIPPKCNSVVGDLPIPNAITGHMQKLTWKHIKVGCKITICQKSKCLELLTDQPDEMSQTTKYTQRNVLTSYCNDAMKNVCNKSKGLFF